MQVFLLTVILFLLFIFYNNSDFTFSGEEKVLEKIDVATSMLVPAKQNKLPYDFVFINVSKDLQLVKDEDGGDNVITDREKLTAFYKVLAEKNEHAFLISDIFFELPSEQDSLMAYEISRLRKAVFPNHYGDTGLLHSVIPVPSAVADYSTNTKKFSKFRLIQHDSDKTIPVVVHETLQHVHYTYGFWGVHCNGKYCLQSIAPRFFIRTYQLKNMKEYPYFNLGELLILANDSTFYDQFLKNRFIVLGNFDTDVHTTTIGRMPGSLILLNTYLSLLNGKHMVSPWWFVTMFILFAIINFHLLFHTIRVPKLSKQKKWWQLFINDKLNGYISNIFSIVGLCLLITVISDYVFKIKPHTFIIFMYIIIVQGFLKYYRVWKEE